MQLLMCNITKLPSEMVAYEINIERISGDAQSNYDATYSGTSVRIQYATEFTKRLSLSSSENMKKEQLKHFLY
jgi:hypothetical protein